MENVSTVNGRISEILTHYQLNAGKASKILGYASTSKLYKFLSGDFKPGYDSLVEILATWPEISGDWLLMGRGPMLRAGVAGAEGVMPPKSAALAQRGLGSGQVVLVTVDRVGKENTGMVTAQAQAGYARAHTETGTFQDMKAYHVPGFEGSYRAFEVAGDSMHPTYKHHDIVICSLVDRWDLLRPDESYVLVTAENVLLKRLVAPITDRRGTIELHSDNTGQYGVHTMPVADLLELWMVRGYVSTKAPGRPDSAGERLREAVEELGHNYHEVLRFLKGSAGGSVELRGALLDVK